MMGVLPYPQQFAPTTAIRTRCNPKSTQVADSDGDFKTCGAGEICVERPDPEDGEISGMCLKICPPGQLPSASSDCVDPTLDNSGPQCPNYSKVVQVADENGNLTQGCECIHDPKKGEKVDLDGVCPAPPEGYVCDPNIESCENEEKKCDPETENCEETPGKKEDGPRQCDVGYEVEDGDCVPTTEICFEGKCGKTCPKGYKTQIQNDEFRCVCEDLTVCGGEDCPDGTILNADKKVCEPMDQDCPAGTEKQVGPDGTVECVPIVVVCRGDVCEVGKCPVGTIFDASLKECLPKKCEQGTQYNPLTDTCEIPGEQEDDCDPTVEECEAEKLDHPKTCRELGPKWREGSDCGTYCEGAKATIKDKNDRIVHCIECSNERPFVNEADPNCCGSGKFAGTTGEDGDPSGCKDPLLCPEQKTQCPYVCRDSGFQPPSGYTTVTRYCCTKRITATNCTPKPDGDGVSYCKVFKTRVEQCQKLALFERDVCFVEGALEDFSGQICTNEMLTATV